MTTIIIFQESNYTDTGFFYRCPGDHYNDFSGEYVPLAEYEAQLAALTAERDKLRAAVKDMLHIFDRGLAEGTIGQIVCERAWQTLEVTK